MKNELEGFVLFQSTRTADFTVGIILSNNAIRMTAGAYRQLGEPEFINVFFDEINKRMMIKKADKRMANIFKTSKGKTITSSSVRTYLMHIIGLETPITQLIRFEGHNPGSPDTVIFDLSKWQVIKQKSPEGLM